MRRLIVLLTFVLVLVPGLLLPLSAGAQPAAILAPADQAFEDVWGRADGPVADGTLQRSWLWGPYPIGVAYEQYRETTTPGGQRLVQYWDKARMEITYPDGDPSSPYYVTNGLLVQEMVTGRRQFGDNTFFPDVSNRSFAAFVPVAGDVGATTSPTYSSFFDLLAPVSDNTGVEIDEWVDRQGNVTSGDAPENVTYASFQGITGHNIAGVFWNFMNDPSSGVLDTTGSWLDPMGYPITEAYWATVQVGGVEKSVLVQLFERRVLTYTPDNDPAWRVEMGNVGRAYEEWAKSPGTKFYPTFSPDGTQVAYSGRYWGNFDIMTVNVVSGEVREVSRIPYDDTLPRWLSDDLILYNSFDPGNGTYLAEEAHIFEPGTPTFPRRKWAHPTPSPDGSMVVYGYGSSLKVSSVDGSMDIAIPNADPAYYTVVWSADSSTVGFIQYDSSTMPWTETLYVWQVGSMMSAAVSGFSGGLRSIALSSNGSQMAVTNGQSQLFLGNVVTGLAVTEVTASGVRASPTSDTLYYTGKDRGVWEVGFDGLDPEKLTSPLLSDTSIDVSYDGTMLVFRRTTLGNDQLVLLDLITMQEQVLVSF